MSVEKYGRPGARAEDHDAALLEVPDRATRDVGLGDLAHRDRGLHPRLDALLLQEVLEGEAVHHDAEHAHVVGPGTVHAVLLELGAAEEVAATGDDRHLGAGALDLGDLPRDPPYDVGVDADLAAAEDLAGQLQQDPLVRRHAAPFVCCACGCPSCHDPRGPPETYLWGPPGRERPPPHGGKPG